MTRITIVHSTGHGHTRTIAEHIERGARSFGDTDVTRIEIHASQLGNDGRWRDDAVMKQLDDAHAIVFGAPTFMGSIHGVFKLFLEQGFVPWLDQVWKDKIAAGFTNSGSRSGDKLVSLQQLSVFAAQMGMVWVGLGDPPGGNYTASQLTDVNVNGAWLGLAAQSYADGTPETAPHPGDRLTAERFGRRIARVTSRWMIGASAYPPQPISEKESRRRNIAGPDEWRRFED